MFKYKSQVDDALARDFARQVLLRSGALRAAAGGIFGAVVLGGGAVWGYQLFGNSWMVGSLATLSVVALVVTLERLVFQYARLLGRVRARSDREIKINELGLSIRTTDAEATWPWHSIRGIQGYDAYLVVSIDENSFICLPRAEMPQGAAEYLTQHIWQSWRPPNNALEQTRDG